MKFPKTEAELYGLAMNIANGPAQHEADFPSLNPTELNNALEAYMIARNASETTHSAAKVATASKTEAVSELEQTIKNMLKNAEVDVAANPEKLAEIGWGPRSEPTSITAPNSPTNLTPIFEGDGAIHLQWTRPVPDENKPVRNYFVQRREKTESGEFTEWKTVDTIYKPFTHLIDQPTMLQMEYRIIASNPAGESMPSNTVLVVL